MLLKISVILFMQNINSNLKFCITSLDVLFYYSHKNSLHIKSHNYEVIKFGLKSVWLQFL